VEGGARAAACGVHLAALAIAVQPSLELWHREDMRRITVAIDDATYKRARIAAAERDTSVSALVKEYLEQLGSQETATARLKRKECEIRSRILDFSASPRLSRDEIHRRSN
jgi:hypothetical protein